TWCTDLLPHIAKFQDFCYKELRGTTTIKQSLTGDVPLSITFSGRYQIMGAAIRYMVPYQVKVSAGDVKSGKPLSNYFYLQNQANAVGPQSYGSPIPGSGDLQTLLNNFKTAYETNMLPVLSINYKLQKYQIRAITGWAYGSPFYSVTSAVIGAVT